MDFTNEEMCIRSVHGLFSPVPDSDMDTLETPDNPVLLLIEMDQNRPIPDHRNGFEVFVFQPRMPQ